MGRRVRGAVRAFPLGCAPVDLLQETGVGVLGNSEEFFGESCGRACTRYIVLIVNQTEKLPSCRETRRASALARRLTHSG